MTTEAPLLTQEMADGLSRDIADAERRAEVALADYQHWHERETSLTAVLEYIGPRLGRPLPEVEEEVRAELEIAEARYAEAKARADEAREHLRDVQGYNRIVAAKLAAADPEET